MTSPFGMPTFVKVGKKKTPKQLGAPGTVRPPTESGQASQRDWTFAEATIAAASLTQDYPTILAGDLLLWWVTIENNSTITTPTGWTLLDNQTEPDIRAVCFYRVVDGTEGETETVSFAAANKSAGFMVSIGGSVDFSTNPPEGSITASASWDPPQVVPSAAPNTYLVYAVALWTSAQLDAAPTGYTFINPIPGSKVTSREMYVGASSKQVDVTTAEDPDAFTYSNTAGIDRLSSTVAVLVKSTADVAAGDHTHVEADVTDLDHWTEADHDALDHTGLTGVGGTDDDAIHDNVSGEIAAVTEKATPVSADLLLIEDSAASNAKKRVQIGNLPGSATDHGALTGLSDDDHTQYLLAAGTRAATYLEVSGLTGATGSSPRFVGGTTSGAPASGTFVLGDYVVTEDGNIYVCTTAGSPGTWTAVGAGAATDSDAIHDNVAGEISALTLVTAASGDHVLIEDASDSNNKKRVAASDFLGGGSSSKSYITDPPMAPPGTAHADDDEFDQANATDPTSGSWSWGNQQSTGISVLGGRCYFDLSTSTSRGSHAILKAFPASGDVTADVRVGGHPRVNFHGIAVIFLAGTIATPTLLEMVKMYYNGGSLYVQWATYTTWAHGGGVGIGQQTFATYTIFDRPYLRLKYDATAGKTQGFFAKSPMSNSDYVAIATAVTRSRPDFYGVTAIDESGSTNLPRVYADFFRVNWTPDFDASTDV